VVRKEPLFAIGIVTALVLLGIMGAYGYTKTDNIASLPCLGCLGLAKAAKGMGGFTFDTYQDREHSEVVLEVLKESVIFLHFRTRDCPGCDDIEPTIYKVEDMYDDVAFAHVHLLYEGDAGDLQISEKEEMQIFRTYDIDGKNQVPMMTIITLNEDENGDVRPFFLTEYNSLLTLSYFKDILDSAIESHNQYVGEF